MKCWNRTAKIGLVLLLANFATVQNRALPLVFDRAEFNALVTPTASSDLEGLVGTASYPQNYPFGTGYYRASGQDTGASEGITVEGVRFVGSGPFPFGFETYILAPEVENGFYSLDGTSTLLVGRHLGEIYFPAGVNAFGADFGADSNFKGPADGSPLNFTVHLRNGAIESASVPITRASQFIGYVGGEIDYIILNKNWDGYDFIPYTLVDNFAYAGTLTQSLPESINGFLCLSACFAGLALFHQRARMRIKPLCGDLRKG